VVGSTTAADRPAGVAGDRWTPRRSPRGERTAHGGLGAIYTLLQGLPAVQRRSSRLAAGRTDRGGEEKSSARPYKRETGGAG